MLHQRKWRVLFLYLILIYRYLHADSSKYLHLNNTYIKILQLDMFCAIVRAFSNLESNEKLISKIMFFKQIKCLWHLI